MVILKKYAETLRSIKKRFCQYDQSKDQNNSYRKKESTQIIKQFETSDKDQYFAETSQTKTYI